MRFFVLIAVVFTLMSCGKTTRDDVFYEALAGYVYAYTAGSIGPGESVTVRFANPVVGADQVGQDADPRSLTISPSIEGRLYWLDERTLVLTPASPLPHGKTYQVTLPLGRHFSNVPSALRTYTYPIRVRDLSFDVEVEGISSSGTDARVQLIKGIIRSSDPVDQEAVAAVLSARQGNRALPIVWKHKDGGIEHQFEVQDVQRTAVRSRTVLEWDGRPLGLSGRKGQQEIAVAALDEFIALNARVEQKDVPCAVVNFSDPVSTSQSLEGLLHFGDPGAGYRYAVEGNFVRVFPQHIQENQQTLVVESGVRNAQGAGTLERYTQELDFGALKPGLRLVGRGAIVPRNQEGKVIFPFEAVGLDRVDVEVFKVYASNIMQFLQVNDIEGGEELERVGKIIQQKTVSLSSLNPGASRNTWHRYAIDLSPVIDRDPGALYQVRLAFRRGYTGLPCASSEPEVFAGGQPGRDGWRSIMGGYLGIYFDTEGEGWYWDNNDRYDWSRKSDPCALEFYEGSRFVSRNVYASDLGLTAKAGSDGSLFIAATDLLTASPLSGVQLTLYNKQLQPISESRTGSDGTVYIPRTQEKPFLVFGASGKQRGYVRMPDGASLSLSRFDVAGAGTNAGLKGYLYGERGVWRPGDSLFLNFVLEDKSGVWPPNHPITFELTDPRGNIQHRWSTVHHIGGVYPLHCATNADAPTGNWQAKVQVGSAVFVQPIRIETVKPNRLKVDLDMGTPTFGRDRPQVQGKLAVRWLHGAPAQGLRATVEMQLQPAPAQFDGYKGFVFEDPARPFFSEPQTVFDGFVDQEGRATIPIALGAPAQAPGKLSAQFKVRAFERGGDFSADQFAVDYFPYDRYVGVDMPTDRYGNPTLSDASGAIRVVCLDKSGRPIANQRLEAGLYRCDWRWWWDEDAGSSVAQFNSATHINSIAKATITTDARGMATWPVSADAWGRYLVRVVDPIGGHAAGGFFWRGYPDRLDDMQSRNAAAMMTFSADKSQYVSGDEVSIQVPASENGQLLLTIENGSRVLEHRWIKTKAGDNTITFKATDDMVPSVYAHISLFQPHAQTVNDLPIRLYGVAPILVERQGSQLKPVINMPEVIQPGQAFNISIKESSGKACVYTLAVVDEGLLDLTRFQTPDPRSAFFAREALGVKTWDVYDHVLGAYGAALERLLAVGGDAFNRRAKSAAQVSRFKPVVRHLGPFQLKAGASATHSMKVDDYVGSVRVMAVCAAPASGSKGAYGSTDKTVAVRNPLMIMPTLPRVLGPGESFRLPVEVFAMEGRVKQVNVTVRERSGLATVRGGGAVGLSFESPGQKMIALDVAVGARPGVARFEIEATGGGSTARQEVELEIRNPNPAQTIIQQQVLPPGEHAVFELPTKAMASVIDAQLEASVLPPMNWTRHMAYLTGYPHGCVEQITSAAFPQLFAADVVPMTEAQRQKSRTHIELAISRLLQYQRADGSFSYWPGGGGYANDWSGVYAGHFLVEAKAKGYAVPEALLTRWLTGMQQASRGWSPQSTSYDASLTQAYRLYALALAGKPDASGMNRMREQKNLYQHPAYVLAGAYATSGKPEVAKKILSETWKSDWRYESAGSTLGSALRDEALMLEVYVLLGEQDKAQGLLRRLSERLDAEDASGMEWNTQSLATAIRAFSKYAARFASSAGGPSLAFRLDGGQEQKAKSSKPVFTAGLSSDNLLGRRLQVRNTGSAPLYVRTAVTGQLAAGEEQSAMSNLDLKVRYLNVKGEPLDPGSIPQGTDFIAEVTVARNTAYGFDFNELALVQIFPSGWEITPMRSGGQDQGVFQYRDVRDDRVLTYLGLPAKVRAQTLRVHLHAAYAGRYYLPAVACSAMYDNRIQAGIAGRWVEVI